MVCGWMVGQWVDIHYNTISLSLYIYIYIYIYVSKERSRVLAKLQSNGGGPSLRAPPYIYIYMPEGQALNLTQSVLMVWTAALHV